MPREDQVNALARMSAEVNARYPIVCAAYGLPNKELGTAGLYLAEAILSVVLDEMKRRDEWLPLG